MMFWIGLLIALVAGIIGIGHSREWLKTKLPRISEKHLDFVSLVLLAIGLLISAIDYSDQSITLRQLEEGQRGRTLTTEQKEALRNTLSRLPKTTVYLIGIQGDPESVRFANTIKDVFIAAGWDVDGVWEDIIIGGAGSGVIVRQASNNSESSGQRITDALNQLQITSSFTLKPDLNPSQLEIIVGSRHWTLPN